jgi:diguanylate cyclase (GGDEF)-like protein
LHIGNRRTLERSTAARYHRSAVERSYVLVVDAAVERLALCLESIGEMSVRFVVVSVPEHAFSILERVGPPTLLAADLSLPPRGAFGIIEAVRSMDQGRTRILGWSEFPDVAALAPRRLAGLNVDVVDVAAVPRSLQREIELLYQLPLSLNRRTNVEPAIRARTVPCLLDRNDGRRAVAREMARFRREKRPCSVVLFDIDVATAGAGPPSTFGPLEAAAETLTLGVRASDVAIRWNAEDLLVVLPGLCGSAARTVAERIRASLQASAGQHAAVCGGVAEFTSNEAFESVINRARDSMWLAQARGRNHIG